MITTMDGEVAAVAVVGIGNPLAGDDGAGPAVVEALRMRLDTQPRVLLEHLDGDLFAVSELLPRARRFIFVDAVLGSPPGRVIRRAAGPAHLAPSLHQTDIHAVMTVLAALEVVAPFPLWEVRGITIAPPRELTEGLSAPVAAAVAALVEELASLLTLEELPAGGAS